MLPNNLIRTINHFFRHTILPIDVPFEREKKRSFMAESVLIWLKFFPEEYKQQILDQIDARIFEGKSGWNTRSKQELITQMHRESDAYIDQLSRKRGLKLFLGKDAYILYTKYCAFLEKRKLKNDAVFVKYSRPYLFEKSNDNNYLTLTELIYRNHIHKNTLKTFEKGYRNLFLKEPFYPTVHDRTLSLLHRTGTIRRLNEHKTFCLIDSGMQGGLIFPMKVVLEEEGYRGTFSLFYSFDWLSRLYRGKVYTKDPFVFLELENESIKAYKKRD